MTSFNEWWEENYGEFSGQSPQTKRKMNAAYDVGVEHQQAKVEELQAENQRLANGNTSYYNQAIKQNERIEELQNRLKQAYEDIDTFATAHEALEKHVDRDRSLIQFTQSANRDLIAERDELQKRLDLVLKVVQSMRNEVKHGHMGNEEARMLSNFADDLEQALKGGGE